MAQYDLFNAVILVKVEMCFLREGCCVSWFVLTFLGYSGIRYDLFHPSLWPYDAVPTQYRARRALFPTRTKQRQDGCNQLFYEAG